MFGRTTILSTALSPEACVKRLREKVDTRRFRFGASLMNQDVPSVLDDRAREVRGSVGKNGAALIKEIDYRNSFQTVLRVDIKRQNQGSLIICRASVFYFVIVFMAAWFGVFLWTGGSIAITALRGETIDNVMSSLPILAIPAFGIALVAGGRWFARNEMRCLIDFVCETLEAKPVEKPTPLVN